MIFAVDAAKCRREDEPEGETRTLGDLLYANKANFPVSEEDWFRLVQLIAVGDQLALHSLYEQTHRIVFTLIVRITNNRETAEELTIDVFYDVWRRASAYDPADGSVVGWIMNQAGCRAIDRLRFENRKKRVNIYLENPLSTTAANDPQQTCHVKEQSQFLQDALEVLTPEERQVIESAFFSELAYPEVAGKLVHTPGAVQNPNRHGTARHRGNVQA